MYNGGKILLGILVFLILATSPFWYNMAIGDGTYMPDPKIVCEAKNCVMDTDFMRKDHMGLLDEWRHSTVRDGDRMFTMADGTVVEKSLTRTCLNCHTNKEEFCDACHTYSAVEQPACWDCHIIPENGVKGGNAL